MATTGQQIADKVWQTLNDTFGGGGARYTAAEVLAGINDGRREIALLHPQAYVKSAKSVLEANSRQTLTGLGLPDGTQVIRLLRNWSADGATVGRAITKVQMAQMDSEIPGWHGEVGDEVVHFDTDPQDPTAVYVHPMVTTGGRVEVIYSAVPSTMASLADDISLPDIYANALRYYVLFALLSKRLQGSAGMRGEGAAYYNLMLQALGAKERLVVAADQAQTVKESAA